MKRINKLSFWDNAEKADGCWLWSGSTQTFGYGKYDGRLVHRVVWELTNGQIPDGLCVLHKCDNPPCVNPDHLFLGTKKDNTADMTAKGRDKGRWVKGQANKCPAAAKARGEKHWMAKLSEADIVSIRSIRASGYTHRQMGKMYGVSHSMIGYILRGHNWAHV